MSVNNILHIDMNSFFASVEQAANPYLRGKPIAVAGWADPEKNYARTIVTTASYEARAYKVKTGMTIPEAKRLCPHILIVTADPDKYLDASYKIHEILLHFTDLVEVYSIDECFLDLAGARLTAKEAAVKMKQEIKEKLKLTCSVGIATNKLVAKLASDMKKPDGLTIINDEDIPSLFSKLAAKELWGIGSKTAECLEKYGIKTAKQLGEADEDLLKHEFGILGPKMKLMGQGKYFDPVVSYYKPRVVKTVGHSHTFPEDTCNLDIIKAFMRMLSEKVATRLQRYKLKGRVIHLYVRYADFTGFGMQTSVEQHTDSGHSIFDRSFKIFKTALPLQKKVRLLGISIGQLIKENGQALLFEEAEKDQKVKEVLFQLNEKYGEFSVKPASVILAEKFGIKERCAMIGKYYFDRKID
ncbi:MAG: DNA polymerase IV [Candidatus Firestonebacteria bacterium]|nr:DNA polymerase IV [Candidatus Firestonebacteria bacterium]